MINLKADVGNGSRLFCHNMPKTLGEQWCAKKMMLKQVAEACNMPDGTFYDKARKFENTA